MVCICRFVWIVNFIPSLHSLLVLFLDLSCYCKFAINPCLKHSPSALCFEFTETQVVIDSCCATFAEVQKRGKDFWAEFELYAADLLVGVVVDIALVGMLAPYTRFGKPSTSSGLFGQINRACGALPSR